MELGSITIGIVLFAICILPLVLMSRNSKNNEHRRMKSLINLAQINNSTITKHETCGDYIIGIDENTQKVFFIKQGENETIQECINLFEVKNCIIERNAKTVSQTTSKINLINKLDLTFIPIDKYKKEYKLEFFNAEKTMQLFGELQSIEKWHKEINTFLKR